MNSYYAVVRSTDHLAHYGVKGMQWGVRKALHEGGARGERRLTRQYKKAAKKLAKLNANADIEKQNAKANKLNKVAKIGAKVGTAGVGVALAGQGANHGLHYINDLHKQIATHKISDIDNRFKKESNYVLDMMTFNNGELRRGKISKAEHEEAMKVADYYAKKAQQKYDDDYNKVVNDFNKGKDKRKLGADIGRYASYGGAGLAALGYGAAIGSKIAAHKAKKRTTAEGHAKAVSERDAWKREMNKAFKGTKYAGQYSVPAKNRKKR